MALVFYVVDSGTGLYRIEQGLGVTHTFDPPGTIPVAYVTHNGAGQVVALGQPSTGSGSTYQQAFGYLLGADDLTLIDGMWGPDDGSNSGQWVDVDDPPRVHTGLNVNFDGAGAVYDPGHDQVLVTTVLRGYPDSVSAQDTEDQVAHLSPAGVFLRADADDNVVSPNPFLTSVSAKGVALLGDVLYYCCGPAGSIASYNTVTGAQQCARACFNALDDGGAMTDLQADPATGLLWRMPSGGASDGLSRLQAFYPADVPWGTTSGTPPTIQDTITYADDNTATWGFYQDDDASFEFVGDQVLVSVREWNTSDLSFITVNKDGSSTAPTLIYQDTANVITGGIAWDLLVIPSATPNLTGGSLRRTAYFGRGR